MNNDADAIQSNKQGLNWFDSILCLESMVKSFNLSNFGGDSAGVKPRHIPLCITDLLQRLLLSKVDRTVDQYTALVQASLTKDEKVAFVSELLSPQIEETRKQIEQIEVLKDVQDEYIDSCMTKFAQKMAKILLTYVEVNQAQIISNTINIKEYIEDLLTFTNGLSINKDISRANFDILIESQDFI